MSISHPEKCIGNVLDVYSQGNNKCAILLDFSCLYVEITEEGV